MVNNDILIRQYRIPVVGVSARKILFSQFQANLNIGGFILVIAYRWIISIIIAYEYRIRHKAMRY